VEKIKKRNFVSGIILFLTIVIFIPYESKAEVEPIVNPNEVYTYEKMTEDIKELAKEYPYLIDYKSIGTTKDDRDIWAVKLGRGKVTVMLNGAHHAREWMTSTLLMYMTEQYAKAYKENVDFEGYDVQELLNSTTIWIVPMVNPDGVTLQQKGANSFSYSTRKKLIELNDDSKDFESWKANIEGVDLNRQYPAGWDDVLVTSPGSKNYKGTYPLVTEEAEAMVEFTRNIKPEMVNAYHSSGQVIYWYYNNKKENLNSDYEIASSLAKITGYKLINPSQFVVGAGYKDWFIQEFNRPGFTTEISPSVGETNPPLALFPDVWAHNKKVGLFMAAEGYKLWYKRYFGKEVGKDFYDWIDTDVSSVSRYGTWASNEIVSVRDVLEYYGYSVNWLSDIQAIVAKKNNVVLTIEWKTRKLNLNDYSVDLAKTLRMDHGKMMMPYETLRNAIGASY